MAVEASKQCGRVKPPVIENTLDFINVIISHNNRDIAALLHVNNEINVKDYLKNSLQTPKKIILFMSPEGGYSDKEVLLEKEMGFISLGLGPRVLRTETLASRFFLYSSFISETCD